MASTDPSQSWGAGSNLTFTSFGPPDRCKYEHPRQAGFGSGNRFGALSSGGFAGPSQSQPKYNVTQDEIKTDLTAGKGLPEWIFSAYGPGKNAPRQLFGGPQREQSFEEMRVRHYELAAQGNIQGAVQEAQALYAECLKQGQVILNDLTGAVKYVLDGDNEHPNRIDIVEGKTGGPGFGAPAQPSQPSAFGQPSGLGAAQPAFGKPAFGQPAFGQPSFGQPSAPGQPSFGQPSAPGAAFGQPSTLGQPSAFGQPSGLGAQPAFGQPAFGQPSFGQPSAPKPAFGQPSFGQPASGQPSAPSLGALGQPSAASPFAQMRSQNQQPAPFGQPSQPIPSPFGQPSGQPAAPTGFNQPSQPTPSPFGQPSQQQGPFGQPSQTPFGAPQQPQQQQPSPFGQQPAPTGFGQPAQPAQPTGPPQPGQDGKRPPFIKTDPGELNPFPHMTGQTIRDPMSKKLTTWKGQPVRYINDWPCYLHPQDRQTFVRIQFPDGPPEPASLRDAQGKPEEYTPEINEQYEFFFSNGYFKDGVIPPVPPKSEWVSFDF